MEHEQGEEVSIFHYFLLCHHELQLFDEFGRFILKQNIVSKVTQHWICLVESLLAKFLFKVVSDSGDRVHLLFFRFGLYGWTTHKREVFKGVSSISSWL